MNPPKNQPKTFKAKFDELLEDMASQSVTREEVAEAIGEMAQIVKELGKVVAENTAENKANLSMEIARLGKEVSALEERLRGVVSSSETKAKASLDSELNVLRASIGYLEDWIEKYKKYDDQELRNSLHVLTLSLDEVKASIPKEFDATELTEQVEKNTKDIDELKKRPIGKGGGGTSAIGVAQTFKYIAHTEEPVGDIDGVNTSYTVSNTIWWIAGFTLNGEQIAELPNFTYAGKTITFSSAIPAAYSGKDLEVKYIGT